MGFALLMNLAIVAQFELSKLAHGGADVIHLLVEAKKLAFAEREEHAGDPDHVSLPLERLLSAEHSKWLSLRIDPRRPTPPPGAVTAAGGDTSYFAVVDDAGNAVSGIQSLAEAFGACVMDPSSGIVMNNRMTWFHVDPDHPNALGPAKHPRHTMNAPLILRDDQLLATLGATAGDAQHQTALQIVTAMVDYGFAPQQAVETSRWTHFQPGTGSAYPHDSPDVLVVESRFDSHVLEELKRRGHNVATVGPMEDVGNAGIIWRDPRGVYVCGADPRHGGWAGAF
jgi:gamma-glutamyltranspeptidase/glutathione hydrolase